jgi:Tfp pilus assembly protein PilP
MRKSIILFCTFALLFTCLQPAWAQEQEKQTADQPSRDLTTSEIRKRGAIIYDPAGRRDPFRDLLAGQEIPDTAEGEGIAYMSIDDVVLIGITKVRGQLNAVINGPQGFPYTIRTGDKFADGFVLSINDSKVVFRKTRERGTPLYKPKDVTKEINPEER